MSSHVERYSETFIRGGVVCTNPFAITTRL